MKNYMGKEFKEPLLGQQEPEPELYFTDDFSGAYGNPKLPEKEKEKTKPDEGGGFCAWCASLCGSFSTQEPSGRREMGGNDPILRFSQLEDIDLVEVEITPSVLEKCNFEQTEKKESDNLLPGSLDLGETLSDLVLISDPPRVRGDSGDEEKLPEVHFAPELTPEPADENAGNLPVVSKPTVEQTKEELTPAAGAEPTPAGATSEPVVETSTPERSTEPQHVEENKKDLSEVKGIVEEQKTLLNSLEEENQKVKDENVKKDTSLAELKEQIRKEKELGDTKLPVGPEPAVEEANVVPQSAAVPGPVAAQIERSTPERAVEPPETEKPLSVAKGLMKPGDIGMGDMDSMEETMAEPAASRPSPAPEQSRKNPSSSANVKTNVQGKRGDKSDSETIEEQETDFVKVDITEIPPSLKAHSTLPADVNDDPSTLPRPLDFARVNSAPMGTAEPSSRPGRGSDPKIRAVTMANTFAVSSPPTRRKANKNVVKEGFAEKLGSQRKNWKRRFFRLQPYQLSYFENYTAAREKGSLNLKRAADIIKPSTKNFEICIHMPDRNFRMRCYSKESQDEWYEALMEWVSSKEPSVMIKPSMQGWMEKVAAGFGRNRLRWFVLRRRLEYYTDENLKDRKGNIDIDEILEIGKVKGSKARPHALRLEMQGKRSYTLCVETVEDFENWLRAIKERQSMNREELKAAVE